MCYLRGTMNWIEVALRPPTIPSTFEMSGKKMATEQDTVKNKMVDTTFLYTSYILFVVDLLFRREGVSLEKHYEKLLSKWHVIAGHAHEQD